MKYLKYLLLMVILVTSVNAQSATKSQKRYHWLVQSMDVMTTLQSVNMGAVELNPLMKPIVRYPGIFITIKFGSTLYINKTASQRDLRIINGFYTAIIINNLWVIAKLYKANYKENNLIPEPPAF